MPVEKEVSLSQLFLNHWRLTIAIICASIGLAGLVTLVLPRRYESEMKFLVNNERADLVITPDKNQSTAAPSEVTETQVNSEMELLKSHDNLESVVLDHQLYLPFESSKSTKPSRKSIERASLKLQKALNITALRKTNIIDVTYRDAEPDLTVAVLQDLGDHYLTSHLAVHRASSTGGCNTFLNITSKKMVKRFSRRFPAQRLARPGVDCMGDSIQFIGRMKT